MLKGALEAFRMEDDRRDSSAGGVSDGPGPDLTLEMALGILRRRKWMILGTVLLGTALATFIGLQVTPKYTAQALVVVERPADGANPESALPGSSAIDPGDLETQVEILASRTNLRRAVAEFDLTRYPQLSAAGDGLGSGWKPPADALWRRLRSLVPQRWLLEAGAAEEPVAQLKATDLDAELAAGARAEAAALSRLEQGVVVAQEGRSYVIGVRFTSTNAECAAAAANAVAGAYVQAELEQQRAGMDRASALLGEEMAKVKGELQQSELAVEQYRAANGLAGERRVDVTDQQVAQLNQALTAAQAELTARQARLTLIRQQGKQGRPLDSLPEVLGSPVIVDLRRQEADLSRQQGELSMTFGEKHPQMQRLAAEREKLEERISAEVGRIVADLEEGVRVEEARVRAIRASLDDVGKASDRAQAAEVGLGDLRRQAEARRQLYETLVQRYDHLHEQSKSVMPDARVISTAAPPSRQSSPGHVLFAGMGLTASIMLGTMLAFLLERLDKGLRSELDVSSALGLPRVGLVPRLERLPRSLRPHKYLLRRPLSSYTESVRGVMAALRADGRERRPRSVLITSSVPNEGKTTLAISLAVYAAHSGERVILLDLDLRHPRVLDELGGRGRSGIVECLTRHVPLDEAIFRHDDLNLDVLGVSERPGDPMELLASLEMEKLLARLRAEYDYIFIDSPPLPGVTDAQIIAPLVDSVLVVAQWGSTRREHVRSAVDLLRRVNAKICGVVLTRVHLKRHAKYGYCDAGAIYTLHKKYYVN